MKIWTIQLDIYFFSSAFFSSAFFSLHLQISSSFKPAKAWLICWPQPNYKVSIWSYSQPGVISYQPKYISCNQDKLHAYTFWIILEIRERWRKKKTRRTPSHSSSPFDLTASTACWAMGEHEFQMLTRSYDKHIRTVLHGWNHPFMQIHCPWLAQLLLPSYSRMSCCLISRKLLQGIVSIRRYCAVMLWQMG